MNQYKTFILLSMAVVCHSFPLAENYSEHTQPHSKTWQNSTVVLYDNDIEVLKSFMGFVNDLMQQKVEQQKSSFFKSNTVRASLKSRENTTETTTPTNIIASASNSPTESSSVSPFIRQDLGSGLMPNFLNFKMSPVLEFESERTFENNNTSQPTLDQSLASNYKRSSSTSISDKNSSEHSREGSGGHALAIKNHHKLNHSPSRSEENSIPSQNLGISSHSHSNSQEKSHPLSFEQNLKPKNSETLGKSVKLHDQIKQSQQQTSALKNLLALSNSKEDSEQAATDLTGKLFSFNKQDSFESEPLEKSQHQPRDTKIRSQEDQSAKEQSLEANYPQSLPQQSNETDQPENGIEMLKVQEQSVLSDIKATGTSNLNSSISKKEQSKQQVLDDKNQLSSSNKEKENWHQQFSKDSLNNEDRSPDDKSPNLHLTSSPISKSTEASAHQLSSQNEEAKFLIYVQDESEDLTTQILDDKSQQISSSFADSKRQLFSNGKETFSTLRNKLESTTHQTLQVEDRSAVSNGSKSARQQPVDNKNEIENTQARTVDGKEEPFSFVIKKNFSTQPLESLVAFHPSRTGDSPTPKPLGKSNHTVFDNNEIKYKSESHGNTDVSPLKQSSEDKMQLSSFNKVISSGQDNLNALVDLMTYHNKIVNPGEKPLNARDGLLTLNKDSVYKLQPLDANSQFNSIDKENSFSIWPIKPDEPFKNEIESTLEQVEPGKEISAFSKTDEKVRGQSGDFEGFTAFKKAENPKHNTLESTLTSFQTNNGIEQFLQQSTDDNGLTFSTKNQRQPLPDVSEPPFPFKNAVNADLNSLAVREQALQNIVNDLRPQPEFSNNKVISPSLSDLVLKEFLTLNQPSTSITPAMRDLVRKKILAEMGYTSEYELNSEQPATVEVTSVPFDTSKIPEVQPEDIEGLLHFSKSENSVYQLNKQHPLPSQGVLHPFINEAINNNYLPPLSSSWKRTLSSPNSEYDQGGIVPLKVKGNSNFQPLDFSSPNPKIYNNFESKDEYNYQSQGFSNSGPLKISIPFKTKDDLSLQSQIPPSTALEIPPFIRELIRNYLSSALNNKITNPNEQQHMENRPSNNNSDESEIAKTTTTTPAYPSYTTLSNRSPASISPKSLLPSFIKRIVKHDLLSEEKSAEQQDLTSKAEVQSRSLAIEPTLTTNQYSTTESSSLTLSPFTISHLKTDIKSNIVDTEDVAVLDLSAVPLSELKKRFYQINPETTEVKVIDNYDVQNTSDFSGNSPTTAVPKKRLCFKTFCFKFQDDKEFLYQTEK